MVAHAQDVPREVVPISFIALDANGAIVMGSAQAGILTKVPKTPTPPGVLVYRQMVTDAFPDAPVMVRIAEAESRFAPKAQNPHSTAGGLFQILDGTWVAYGCQGSKYEAQDNIACARTIYNVEGTRPWGSSIEHWAQ